MANRLQHLWRAGLAATGAVVLGASGCAFPNGITGGDPLLGNFNRPIVATPPPERSGLGLDSPAYDGGARIGFASPDIPTAVENSGGGLSLPQPASPSPPSGARLPIGDGADEPYLAQRPVGPVGARLTSSHDSATPRPSGFGRTIPDGLAFVPPEPTTTIRLAGFEPLKDPSKVKSMEDGQGMLQTAGATGQKLEQLPGGEWVFTCTVGIQYFEACGPDPLEAMKAVLEQIQKDRQGSSDQ